MNPDKSTDTNLDNVLFVTNNVAFPYQGLFPAKDPMDESSDHTLNRLVMINPSICMLCSKRGENHKSIELHYRWGWIYCSECEENQRIKRAIVGYLAEAKSIPFFWINQSPTFAKIKDLDEAKSSGNNENHQYGNATLKFFRHSQKDTDNPVFEATIETYDESAHIMSFSEKHQSFHTVMRFMNQHGEQAERSVSLQNLFGHNPGLYQELVSCQDLLACSIKISYTELSEFIHNSVESAQTQRNGPGP